MLPSRTVGVAASVVASSPSSYRVGGIDGGQRLRLPFMIDGGRLFPFERRHDRRVGRIDAIDDVGQVLAVADGLVGGEGIGGESHWYAFASGRPRAWP